ncbi:Protein of unknown function [Marinobacter sp. DSM 26671]|uniref:DUF3306 domain-containing protein n=1 Tax=Marinobacter sp. DSM 26671 TaxID=1761793 RepID=UPI0008F05E33|nr:DUF3306 domain-containing protein [Marinobacter sp. DSM 26671]SFE30910.1 Protein of unknown function [Marinobacter sp. DSM 26671]
MAESRLQRWARKKAEAAKRPEPSPPPVIEAEPAPEEQELAINEALPEHELLEKYGLPDPENIELGTDITGFMRKEIPEFLRRKALRGLWKSNPVLAVLDGLNDYDEDYTLASTAGQTVKTLYKVGEGLVDKARKAADVVEDQSIEQVRLSTDESDSTITQEPEPDDTLEPEDMATPTEPPEQQLAQQETSQPEEQPEPRFRPRMRFDY